MNALARRLFCIAAVAGFANAQTHTTLQGTITGAPAGERILVTLWHRDFEHFFMEPLAEKFAAADGTLKSLAALVGDDLAQRDDTKRHLASSTATKPRPSITSSRRTES